MTDLRLDPISYRPCDRCDRDMTRQTRSEIDGAIICTVCVEKEMEEKDETTKDN